MSDASDPTKNEKPVENLKTVPITPEEQAALAKLSEVPAPAAAVEPEPAAAAPSQPVVKGRVQMFGPLYQPSQVRSGPSRDVVVAQRVEAANAPKPKVALPQLVGPLYQPVKQL